MNIRMIRMNSLHTNCRIITLILKWYLQQKEEVFNHDNIICNKTISKLLDLFLPRWLLCFFLIFNILFSHNFELHCSVYFFCHCRLFLNNEESFNLNGSQCHGSTELKAMFRKEIGCWIINCILLNPSQNVI